MKHGKKYQDAAKLIDRSKLYEAEEAVALVKKTATAMPVKMKYIYSCIPVSMAIMMVHALLMGTEEALKEVKG